MLPERAEPWVRPAGRTIVVDAADRLLLIRSEDPSIDVPVLWFTPGGGCELDETPRQAAIRELWEETGIRLSDVGPCVWQRQHVWRFGDRLIDSREHFFLVRVHRVERIEPAAASSFEQSITKEFRWWSIDELQSATDTFFFPARPAAVNLPASQWRPAANPARNRRVTSFSTNATPLQRRLPQHKVRELLFAD